MTTQAAQPAPTLAPLPRTAPAMRARQAAILVRLQELEVACLTATGLAYRRLSDEANAAEAEALLWERMATRLERQAQVAS